MNKKRSILLLTIIFLVTLGSTYFISKLKFNYDFESYFPTHDEDLEYLLKFRKRYENDTDFLAIGIRNTQGVFDHYFLQKVASLTNKLKNTPDVRKVTSLTSLKLPVAGPAGFIEVPLVHMQDSSRWASDSVYIFKNPQIRENLISEDGKSLLIVIHNTQDIKKAQGDRLLHRVEQLLESYHFDEIHVAGKIKASIVYVEKMKTELLIFISISTILISFFLFIAYRSLWGILIPLITVIVAITITLGIMGVLVKILTF